MQALPGDDTERAVWGGNENTIYNLCQTPQSYLEIQETGKQGPNQALVLDTNFKGMSKIIIFLKKAVIKG